jgi:tRNA-Thr(GGU) m(6)t(6)A37 methyltransferase TsaA
MFERMAHRTDAMTITLSPIGYVRNSRTAVEDDAWGSVVSEITLVEPCDAECLEGIQDFSHVEVLFHFDRVTEAQITYGARHPRNNRNWPRVGILAQRGKNRPNRLGLCTARVVARRDATLVLEGLDAVDGTPVLDIKPVMKEFLPRGEIYQPDWSSELMKKYW